MGGNNEFFENFERNKYLKKLPSMQRVNNSTFYSCACEFLSKAYKAARKMSYCMGKFWDNILHIGFVFILQEVLGFILFL